MAMRAQKRGSSWCEEAVSHYLDRHPLAGDRLTPLGAPLEEADAVARAAAAGELLSLQELGRLPAAALSDPDRLESQAAAMFVNFYAIAIVRGQLEDVGELLIALGGLDDSGLGALEPAYLALVAATGDLAGRLLASQEDYQRAIARLRSTHHRFFDVATADRHRETARLHAAAQGTGRPPPENEFLRDSPARIERSFNLAVGKLTLATRDAEATWNRLYDPSRWRRLAAPASQAMDACRALRSDAEGTAARAGAFPRIRRAAGDLRGSALHACTCAESAHARLILPTQLVEALTVALGAR